MEASSDRSQFRFSRRSSLAVGAGLVGSVLGLRGVANGAPARPQQRGASSEEPTHFAFRTFHLSSEETLERWGNPEGWLLSGLEISADVDDRIAVELWDPHASYDHPVLWQEVQTVAGTSVRVVAGCQVTAPYLARICVSGPGEELVTAGGCLLPTATRPPPNGFSEEFWGGDPGTAKSSWIDKGTNSTKCSLDTPLMISWASWNGPGTDEVLSLSFEYPGVPPEGRSVAIHWNAAQKELANRPLPEWPNATWIWCVRRA